MPRGQAGSASARHQVQRAQRGRLGATGSGAPGSRVRLPRASVDGAPVPVGPGRWPGGLACLALRSGASTMVMLRPSSLGAASTLATAGNLLRQVLQDLHPELGVAHLTAPEHDRDLDLVAVLQEPADLARFGEEVARADLGPVLHLLDGGVGRLFPGLLGPLGGLVLETVVVHDPAHGRVGIGCHLDQVEVQLPCYRERLGERFDPELVAIGVDQADFPGANALVDPVVA